MVGKFSFYFIGVEFEIIKDEPIAKVEIKLNLPSPAHEARVCPEPGFQY